jgi:hypothetical protein
MKQIALFITSLLYLNTSYAHTSGEKYLLDALTLCPQRSSPATSLAGIAGNQFQSVIAQTVGTTTIIRADAYNDSHLVNRSILSPAIFLGKFLITLKYVQQGNDNRLVCQTSVAQPEVIRNACLEVRRAQFKIEEPCRNTLRFEEDDGLSWKFLGFDKNNCRIAVTVNKNRDLSTTSVVACD